ncbi:MULTISPECIES: hypothetical protein [Sphingobacterium]|uniref:hypothetical protein n=1 Tax=Sphingobacterium TaxID=28453 RepID=UPI00104ADA55|nr:MULTISPECIES: hypothetical protein [Sphingobacterium]MCW2258687.1 hypothetical protein [Sphingobacterium kitahiroshimense]TCR14857.1 hypothetical protein EDF67_101964 [Sphingobacterium sp. JUb78]
MQNTCYWDSYALTLREVMSSYLRENRVPVIKKRTMITLLPERFFKTTLLPISESFAQSAMKYVIKERPSQRYYSLMIRLLEPSDSFSMVVRNDNTDVLRISLINMTVYEIYLFALGLPANFRLNQILVLGEHKERFIPLEKGESISSYCYELAVPARTEREEYRQRILNDLNKHFGIEVSLERLTIVKDSRKVLSIVGESVELIWEEQLMMIIKAKRTVKENQELILEKY